MQFGRLQMYPQTFTDNQLTAVSGPMLACFIGILEGEVRKWTLEKADKSDRRIKVFRVSHAASTTHLIS